MTNRWSGCIKIHEQCASGGIVRWIEAVYTPGVGYYGECTACGATELKVEEIVPVEIPEGVRKAEFKRGLDGDEFVNATWDEAADWDANQERLREAIRD